jgi:WD40 repeat protein
MPRQPRLDAPGTLQHVIIRGIEKQPIVTNEEDWQQVVSGSFDYTLKVWDLQSRQLLRSLEGHTDWVTSVAVTPGEYHVVSGSRQAIADHLLKSLPATGREEVLGFCAEEKLSAPPVLDSDTLAAIARHTIEICNQWQWP